MRLTPSGHIEVDKVSRTNVRGVYAAGDVTGVLPLASVAAMQGRLAMAHALGDAVTPLSLRGVSANIFTSPEIATVGSSEARLQEQGVKYSREHAAAGPQPARQDAGRARRVHQDLRPRRHRDRARRAWWSGPAPASRSSR